MTVVIGTAGHIDHGKTTLLRALTGIDADRLPEERRRGMTIEVGYAHLAFDDGTVVDFVDVPGHEKLVGNMLVGAGEIDAALLVVAADDGPRAQTIEHLGVLDALGLTDAVIALSKVDVLDGDADADVRLAERRADVRALIDRTTLAGSPIVDVSGITGLGIEELRGALRDLIDRVGARRDVPAPHPARIAIDRVFAVKGRGIVVTGSLRGGPLAVGDSLLAQPGRASFRVRELQVRNTRVDRVASGGRVALNLVGPGAERLERGQVLTADPSVATTRRVLVHLRPPFDPGARPATGVSWRAPWPPAPTAAMRLFSGTAQVAAAFGRGRLDGASLPDGSMVATLRLESSIALAVGDALVLRRPAPIGTVAAGIVLDVAPPTGPSRRRMTPDRLAALTLARDEGSVVAARLELHGARPRGSGRVGWELAPEVASAAANEGPTLLEAALDGRLGHAELRAALARGVRRRVAIPVDAARDVAADVVAELVADGRLVRDGDVVTLPGRMGAAGPPPETLAAMDRLEKLLAVPAPPPLSEAAATAGCPEDGIRALETAGRIVRLEPDLAWAAAAYRDLEAEALRLARLGPLTPASLRDATATSRKFVMTLLEDFDRRGILRRTPAGHVPGPRAPR